MKKCIKRISLALYVLILSIQSFSQSTFKVTLVNPNADELVNDVTELQDGSFILGCVQLNPTPYKLHLVKLSNSGVPIRDTIYNFENQYSGTFSILQSSPNRFLIAGYTRNENNLWEIWLFHTDSLLNKIDEKIIHLDTNTLYSFVAEIDMQGAILIDGVLNTPHSKIYSFIYKLSSTFDSIQCKIFTDHQVGFQPSLLEKNNGNGYYFFLIGYHGMVSDYNEAILDLDKSFNIINISGVPLLVDGYPNSKWIDSNTIILTGRKDSLNKASMEGLIFDTTFNLRHSICIGDGDTLEWQGLRSNLDLINKDTIYIGGTHNFCPNSEFCVTNSWYSLSNLDPNLHLRWEKFYGGNANYTLYGLKATRDGGCLLYGTYYDSTMNFERDVCVIKVNKDGLINGINDDTHQFIHDFIVYPNPGSDHLVIESGKPGLGAQFKMYTLDGKFVAQTPVLTTRTIVNTSSLHSGVYIWQIESKDKVIESGKWIK